MSKPKMKNPFHPTKQTPVYDTVTSPVSVGVGTSLALVASQKLGKSLIPHGILPKSVSRLPPTVLAVLFGLPVGYLAGKSAEWIRWKVVQQLLSYQGWVTSPRSNVTKAWAVLLKLFKGTPDNTYAYQRALPKQPLPDLDQTLDLWLKMSANIISREELEQTKEAVERFRHNEGPKIQTYLQERSKKTVNWLSDYWTTAAYLSCRDSLAINSNYFLVNKKPDGRVSDWLARAAGCVDSFITFYELIVQSRLPPVELQDLVPLCMNGYRYIFNSMRLPGENLDRMIRHPGETHIVVMRKGHYYRMEMYTECGVKSGGKRRLRQEEIKLQFERICKHADTQPEELPVAALTTLNRTKWAKIRERLSKDNQITLNDIESSLFVVTLDDKSPKDYNEHSKLALSGRGDDRWFDKGFNAVFWPTCVFGCNVEHTGIDAMVFCSLAENLMVSEKYINNDVPRTPEGPDPTLPEPTLLAWKLESFESDIKQAYDEYKPHRDSVDVHILNTVYGKGFMKKCKLSPDGYVQMALQLAYFRLHGHTPKTYEPSTGRLYALGRTENIHPVSVQSKAWVRSMADESSTRQTRQELLRRAINEQNKMRLRATVGQGCDRHLLGLFCASRELGMDIPGLFMDKAWRSPYHLSTSQTPTRTVELGADMDYKSIIGGFGPNCADGYGISYTHMGDDMVNLIISAWDTVEETQSTRMAVALTEALNDMKELFS